MVSDIFCFLSLTLGFAQFLDIIMVIMFFVWKSGISLATPAKLELALEPVQPITVAASPARGGIRPRSGAFAGMCLARTV